MNTQGCKTQLIDGSINSEGQSAKMLGRHSLDTELLHMLELLVHGGEFARGEVFVVLQFLFHGLKQHLRKGVEDSFVSNGLHLYNKFCCFLISFTALKAP